MCAFIALIKFRAHQHAISKCKSPQVVRNDIQILIVEFFGQHPEECCKTLGTELRAVLISKMP